MSTELQPSAQSGHEPGAAEEDTISLVDLLVALGEGKVPVAACTAVGVALGLYVALTTPVQFTAKTVIMPPQQGQSAAAALANLGGLAGAAGVAGAGGVRSSDEMYAAFLRGERIETAMVKRFKLTEVYQVERVSDARLSLKGATTVAVDRKSGLLTVSVVDADPAFAARLANGYYEELKTMLATLAVSEAQQRRQFFEQQVLKARDQLAAAELRFKTAQRDSGLLATQALAESGVKASVELRTQIASREVQLQALRGSYATAQNPDVLRLSSELAALRAQLRRVEQGRGGDTPAGPSGAADASADGGQPAVKAFREFKTQEGVLDGLVRQLEIARLDESREGPVLQQAEPATPPERKSGPRRLNILAAYLAVGLLLGLVWAFGRHWWRLRRTEPRVTEQVARLKQAWRLGR